MGAPDEEGIFQLRSHECRLCCGLLIFVVHFKYVLVPADKAANNVVVVCRLLHYINTLKQEHNGTKAYEETSTDEKYVVNSYLDELSLKFSVCNVSRDAKTNFLQCIGYLSFTKDSIKLGPLQTLALALL